MKLIKVLTIMLIMVSMLSSKTTSATNCPPFIGQSFMTQNHDGRSTYFDPWMRNFFTSLRQAKNFNLETPVLDIGAGYGVDSYELINFGAKNIYINDLDKRNLACMDKYISKHAKAHGTKLNYLPGDITNARVLERLPDNAFGFVVAKNVIHFLSYQQLMILIKALNKKVAKDGIVVILYENPYLTALNRMIDVIFREQKKYPRVGLDRILKNVYTRTWFPGFRQCALDAYQKASKEMRLPGFPCEIQQTNGFGQLTNKRVQLLMPGIITTLMHAAGFEIYFAKPFSLMESRQILAFVKMYNLSETQIDANIKRAFKKLLLNPKGKKAL